ncbi:hypothetical protein ON010_g11033 [Phytophthora cinnamomi]|nr:hypothetical protein ON010_g11033 [Phytophthora cinnamomi]
MPAADNQLRSSPQAAAQSVPGLEPSSLEAKRRQPDIVAGAVPASPLVGGRFVLAPLFLSPTKSEECKKIWPRRDNSHNQDIVASGLRLQFARYVEVELVGSLAVIRLSREQHLCYSALHREGGRRTSADDAAQRHRTSADDAAQFNEMNCPGPRRAPEKIAAESVGIPMQTRQP